MELQELFLGVLTKTLNKTEEEVSALLYNKAEDSDELVLKEDAINLVLDADVLRVDNIKKGVKPDKEALESQYSRGKKEALTEMEGNIREYFKTENDAEGLDLVKAIVNDANKSKKPLTEDEVKAHPLFINLEKERVPKEMYTQLQTEFDDYKSNQAKNARLSDFKKYVITHFNTLNAIQSTNPQVAKTRMDDFLSKFDQYDVQEDGDNNWVITKDGTRLEDDHSNPLKTNDFIVQMAQLNYDFAENTARSSAGNDQGGNGSGSHVDVPKTEAEYVKNMANEPDPAKRVSMMQAWKAANP